MELVGNFISTIGELNEILAITDKLVLLYFYSEWSPACRRIRFEFMQAMSKNPEAEYIAANIDNCKALARKLQISLDDIPALVVFKDGQIMMTLKHITASKFNVLEYLEPLPGPGPRDARDVDDEVAPPAVTRKKSLRGSSLKAVQRKKI